MQLLTLNPKIIGRDADLLCNRRSVRLPTCEVYEVNGLGIPFELLYFDEREELTNVKRTLLQNVPTRRAGCGPGLQFSRWKLVLWGIINDLKHDQG